MPLFGTITIWIAVVALIISMGSYLTACVRRGKPDNGAAFVRLGRGAFILAAGSTLATAFALGTLLLTHRFDIQYVYDHSARAMSPLYYFPSFWAGQEGSFLLWGFWIAILGVVLALTSGATERRVMPIYGSVLLFLMAMLVIKPPFLPTVDSFGIQVTPTEGLGLNPNLENYWMVIHPPTLFLGFAALTVPFAFALSALCWQEWEGWLKRALPWGLFGFAILGLAMMMGGYWAYEMLGWGGFWEWDPVENGPFVPWMLLLGFLHAAQIQRLRGGFLKPTLLLALLPFSGALYETFLTRTGILDKFSVHSFSTLGGNANNVLLGVLLLSVAASVGALLWRLKAIPKSENTTDDIQSREFGYTMAIVLLTLCATIAAVGLSAPLLTSIGVKLHLADFQGAVREDYHNKAMFPMAVLLALGMGIGPHLAWRGKGGMNSAKLVWAYAISVIAALGFVLAAKHLGTPLTGGKLIPQLLLFTASVFAIVANVMLLTRLFPRKSRQHSVVRPVWTVGGTLSHLGAAVMLVGIVCLIVFVKKDTDVLLIQNRPAPLMDGAYTAVFQGMSGNPERDKDNALLVDVASTDGRERFKARLPYALRAPEGGGKKMVFAHPAILHHGTSDLYLFMSDGTGLEDFYKTPVWKPTLKLGDVKRVNITQDPLHPKVYTVEFMRFDNPMGPLLRQGIIPDVQKVSAVLRVTYQGKTTMVSPQFIQYADNSASKSPEIKLPGGALISFAGMNAGSSDQANPGAGAMNESAALNLREDSGPPSQAFYLEATTRPMINLVWIGTLLLVFGGLISMRRRILENRLEPVADLVDPTPKERIASPSPKAVKHPRHRTAKPAPSMFAGKGGGR
ncbi:MAG: cytochrome c biogenesis protein CcsA [Janthinobacterium lividum]